MAVWLTLLVLFGGDNARDTFQIDGTELFIMYFEMHDCESASYYSLQYLYTLMLDVYILNLFHEFYDLSKWKFRGRFLFQ